MPCCGRRSSKAQMTETEKAQSSLKSLFNALMVFNVINVIFSILSFNFFGLLFFALWTLTLMVGYRGIRTKNEDALRKYIGMVLCNLCIAVFLVFMAIAALNAHQPHVVQMPEGVETAQPQETRPMTGLRDPTDPKGSSTDPTMPLHGTADGKTMQELQPTETSEPSKEEPSKEEHHGEHHGKKRHHGGMLVGLTLFFLYQMTQLSIQLASIIQAARVVRLFRLERLSAHAMMSPHSQFGDVALQAMPANGQPQVFYMPTADGMPQYVVYQPVAQV